GSTAENRGEQVFLSLKSAVGAGRQEKGNGMTFDVLAEGLQFPEGPIAMPDGSVILVEIARGTLSRVWDGTVEVVCDLGGGPNGAAFGPDGAVYVANNGGGGLPRGAQSLPPKQGGIDRVDLATGKGERLYDKVGEHALS